MLVVKRNGKTETLSADKVTRAILMAMNAAGSVTDPKDITEEIVETITGYCGFHESKHISVNEIQDITENALIDHGHVSAARKFIAYRHDRDRARQERLEAPKGAITNYINAAKYARWVEDLERRETKDETVDRVQDMHIRKFPDQEDVIRNAFDGVRLNEQMPSMRTMQFGGVAVETKNARTYNCSYSLVDRIDFFKEAFYLLLCGCGVGFSVQKQHVAKLPKLTKIDGAIRHHVVGDSIEGWCDALHALIESYYLTGEEIEFAYHEIRPEGSRLKTSGGKAPGHKHLKIMLEAVKSVLHGAQGRRLRPIEAHDIICHIAVAVLSGGIRRSSLISLFTATDTQMLYAKAKENYDFDTGLNTHRAMANNSAVLLRSEARQEDLEEIIQIAQDNYGCPGFFFTDNLDHGTNPCFAGDTWIHTDEGLKQIGDLVGQEVYVAQADGSYERASAIELTQKNAQTYRIKFKSGRELVVTSNHEFPTENRGRLQTWELEPGDKLKTMAELGVFSASPEQEFLSSEKFHEGLVRGMWQGDGTQTDKASYVCVYDKLKDHEEYLTKAVGRFNDGYRWQGGSYSSAGHSRHLRLGGTFLAKVTGFDKSCVPQDIMEGDLEIIRGYLQGLFVTDGSVQGRVGKSFSMRLSQSNKLMLQQVQILLSNFGIQSSLRLVHQAGNREMPGGTYHCKDNYELILSRQNMDKFMERVGLFGPNLEKWEAITTEAYKKDDAYDYVVSVEEDIKQDVYCLNVYKTHNLIANGLEVGNCGEIGLNPVLTTTLTEDEFLEITEQYQMVSRSMNADDEPIYTIKRTGFAFCNLTEINGATAVDAEDFYQRAQAATVLGTLQASYTDFKYLGAASQIIAERDALLGVSITGVFDNPEICLDPVILKKAAELTVKTNQVMADALGINPARRITTIKPSGTASLALGCVGSGIHPSHAKRYFRRVTANPNERPAQYFREINPHMVEEMFNGDWSIVFPIEAEEGARTLEDVSAMELCEAVKVLYTHWVKPGTVDDDEGLTHNVSCTVHLQDGELPEVVDWIWENRYDVKAMSFTAVTLDKQFAFAPRRKVYPEDEAKWNMLVRDYTPVDWTKMVEKEDGTMRQMAQACAGMQCDN